MPSSKRDVERKNAEMSPIAMETIDTRLGDVPLFHSRWVSCRLSGRLKTRSTIPSPWLKVELRSSFSNRVAASCERISRARVVFCERGRFGWDG